MDDDASRRGALKILGAGLAVAAAMLPAAAEAQAGGGAATLAELGRRLAAAPRRRAFKSTPMILDDPETWDREALSDVVAYRGGERQVWDNLDIGGPWLTTMRNALDVQVFSFKHPDFLVVSLTRGSALLALLDQPAWDRYALAELTGGKFKDNALIAPRPAGKVDPAPIHDPRGPYSAEDASIPALQARGVVFMACHIALWEIAGRLVAAGRDPDRLGQDGVAADLTNRLIPGVVLTPGAVGTLPELQAAGFHLAA